MAIYSTIQEQIDSIEDEEISFRNLHTTAILRYGNVAIRIPYKSIFRTYKSYFDDMLVRAEFTQMEIQRYRKKPKLLSYDLYGTVEMWSSLLEVNDCLSVAEFDFDIDHQPLVFDPTEFKELINEVLILEEVLE